MHAQRAQSTLARAPVPALSRRLPTTSVPAPGRRADTGLAHAAKGKEAPGEGPIIKGSKSYAHLSPVRRKLFEEDPGLNQSLLPSGAMASQLFNQDNWAKYRRVDRYWHNITHIFASTVFRRVLSPALQVTTFAALICIYNHYAPSMLGWAQLTLPQLPHVLAGSAIALLLVFKTNSAFNRFNDGRNLWGRLINNSRDLIRVASTYFSRELAYKAALYVQCYALCMKSHLRLGRTDLPPNDLSAYRDDPTESVTQLLGNEEAKEVLGVVHRPYITMCKLTRLVQEAVKESNLSLSIEKQLGDYITEYGAITGGSERILSTPIPLSYSRHTARCMLLWLFTLPFVLWPSLGFATLPAVFLVSYVYMGIDEIGVEIEEPFAVLPLHQICKVITRDVEIAMSNAGTVRNWECSLNDDGYSCLNVVKEMSSASAPPSGSIPTASNIVI